jgi:hypothetical protein
MGIMKGKFRMLLQNDVYIAVISELILDRNKKIPMGGGCAISNITIA